MAFTTADLDTINQAIATGEQEVEFADGRRVRYRSVAALKEAKAHIAEQLAQDGGNRRPRMTRLSVGKGI